MKLPAIQFYVGDWLRDPVSGCSLAAQGLWLRVMFVLHDSEEYGRLSVNGKPMKLDILARRCSCPREEFIPAWNELLANGVPTVDEDGFVSSRRMMRDATTRENTRTRVAKHRMGKHTPAKEKPATEAPRANPIPPRSLSEVVEYANEKKLCPDEAHDFFHHYDSQGWMKSNSLPILRWKSAFHQWLKRNFSSKKNVTNGKPVSVWALREQEREVESAIESTRDARKAARSDDESKVLLGEIKELKSKLKNLKSQIINA